MSKCNNLNGTLNFLMLGCILLIVGGLSYDLFIVPPDPRRGDIVASFYYSKSTYSSRYYPERWGRGLGGEKCEWLKNGIEQKRCRQDIQLLQNIPFEERRYLDIDTHKHREENLKIISDWRGKSRISSTLSTSLVSSTSTVYDKGVSNEN